GVAVEEARAEELVEAREPELVQELVEVEARESRTYRVLMAVAQDRVADLAQAHAVDELHRHDARAAAVEVDPRHALELLRGAAQAHRRARLVAEVELAQGPGREVVRELAHRHAAGQRQPVRD